MTRTLAIDLAASTVAATPTKPSSGASSTKGAVHRRDLLGGILHEYRPAA